MAKKKVETKVENQNILEKYLIKKGEREIIASFGEYNVYAPNEEFARVMYKIAESSSKRLDKDNNLVIVGEVLSDIYKSITNLPDDLLDNLNELLSILNDGVYNLSRDIKRTIETANDIVNDVLLDVEVNIDKVSKMNPKKRELFLKNQINDFVKQQKTE